jgi:hypothetical protein
MRIGMTSLVLAGGAMLAACTGEEAASGMTAATAVSLPAAPTAGNGALSAAALAAIKAGIQDEYRARSIYERVLLDFGNVRPFSNIVNAERQHAESLAQLFSSRGLALPASEWSSANVPRFASLREACGGAAQAERENVALYDSQLGLDLPLDVRQVLENNRRASLENHLPAFERCS